MKQDTNIQIVISGVGGQGVLFVTRLLAEVAIARGLPVFTSETHGMAQRGGTVISHLKVGGYTSPLIIPGDADGLIALKAESVEQHGGYLKPGAWAAVNQTNAADGDARPLSLLTCDADQLAREIENPRGVNLIMLGFVLANGHGLRAADPDMFCTYDEMVATLEKRLAGKKAMLQASIRAMAAGAKWAGTI